MCKFCRKIETLKFTENNGGEIDHPTKNITQIVHYNEDNSYDLWSDGGGDSFMSGIELEHIKFCPYCGRKLGE
jgi:hypothetical protein